MGRLPTFAGCIALAAAGRLRRDILLQSLVAMRFFDRAHPRDPRRGDNRKGACVRHNPSLTQSARRTTNCGALQ
jgi:hypothetical protein